MRELNKTVSKRILKKRMNPLKVKSTNYWSLLLETYLRGKRRLNRLRVPRA